MEAVQPECSRHVHEMESGLGRSEQSVAPNALYRGAEARRLVFTIITVSDSYP